MSRNEDLSAHDAIWEDIFRRQLLKKHLLNEQNNDQLGQKKLEELILTLRQKLKTYNSTKKQT